MLKRLLPASFLSLVHLAGCGAEAPAPRHLPLQSVSTASAHKTSKGEKESGEPSSEELRKALFERLVAMVHRYHVFAPQTEKNLGKRWEDDLPTLRSEFLAANSEADLSVALFHFGNSLHDVHCQFRPKDRGARLKLGFSVGIESTDKEPRFFVERIANSASDKIKRDLIPGDIVVSVDGIAASELLRHHERDSNANSWTNIGLDVASFLTSRRTSTTTVREGAISTWVVRPRSGGPERRVDVPWAKRDAGDDGDDFSIDYETKDCLNADPKDYGAYELSARGYRVCIYTSKAPQYRDYPIVRHVSFRYDELPHGPLVDYELTRSALAKAKAKGVILDVQDNHGGINPNLFLEWWADKPYTDTETRVILDESLVGNEAGKAKISSMNDAIYRWYREALGTRAPGQRFSPPRPFMCKPETCAWDNRYTPKHRVTTLPVALIVGPACASSCDALAWHFDKEDIGPIVGRPPMGGFTTHRARFDVALSEKAPPLGTIEFAVSYDTVAGANENIEGSTVNIDVPVARTFENHETFDKLLVDGAIDALKKRSSPASRTAVRR